MDLCLDQGVNYSTFLRVWRKNKFGESSMDTKSLMDLYDISMENGSPRLCGTLTIISWAWTCDFLPKFPLFHAHGYPNQHDEEAVFWPWQRQLRDTYPTMSPPPSGGEKNLRCLLYYLPEYHIRTEVQLHISCILLHDKSLIPISFPHSSVELSGISSQINYFHSNSCLRVCL